MPGRRDKSSNEEIAERLQWLRIALEGDRQGSQVAMAKRCGIEPNAWNNYEKATRRIHLDQADLVRDTCGVTLDWIYHGDFTGVRNDTLQKLQQHRLPPPPRSDRRRRA